MKTKMSKIRVINKLDERKTVWGISRPHLSESSSEMNDIMSMDLPIHGFSYYVFEITGSLLIRDLLYQVRPCTCWARSNRTTLITEDTIEYSSEYSPILDQHPDCNYWTSYWSDPKVIQAHEKSVDQSVLQDERKRHFLYSVSTTFCWGVDYRTLSSVIRSLAECKLPEVSHYADLFLEAIGVSSLQGLCPGTDHIFDAYSCRPVADTKLDNLGYGMYRLSVANVTGNILSQIIRLQYSDVRTSLTHKVMTKGERVVSQNDTCSAIIHLTKEQVIKLVKTRSCWFAQFDRDDNNSWSSIISCIIESGLLGAELENYLICDGCADKCKWRTEQLARLYAANPSGCGEVNPPCPILTGIPETAEIRWKRLIRSGGSPSQLLRTWCKYVVDNKSKFKITEDGMTYVKNIQDYGFLEKIDNQELSDIKTRIINQFKI